MTRFLDELYSIGALADPHLDDYDGAEFVTPSLIDHDDGKGAGWTSAGEKRSCH